MFLHLEDTGDLGGILHLEEIWDSDFLQDFKKLLNWLECVFVCVCVCVCVCYSSMQL